MFNDIQREQKYYIDKKYAAKAHRNKLFHLIPSYDEKGFSVKVSLFILYSGPQYVYPGKYANPAPIVKTYKARQQITITIKITAAHKG